MKLHSQTSRSSTLASGKRQAFRRLVVEPLSQRQMMAADVAHNPFDAEEVNDDEYRSIDGTGNNLANPELGSAGENLLRIAAGISSHFDSH